MAGGIESQNQLQELLGLLRKRRWTILLPVLYLGTLGTVIATFLPRKYESETTINIKPANVEEPERISRNARETDTQREITNAEDQIKQPKRIKQIITANPIDWPEYLSLGQSGRDSFVDGIQDDISVFVHIKDKNEGSTFIDVHYRDTVRERAPKLLRELSKRWVEDVYDAEVNRMRQVVTMQKDKVAEVERQISDTLGEIQKIEDREGVSLLTVTEGRPGREADPILTQPDMIAIERLALADKIEVRETALEAGRVQLTELEPMVPGPAPPIPPEFGAKLQEIKGKVAQAEAQLQKYKPASAQYSKLERLIAEFEQEEVDLRELLEESMPDAELQPNPVRLKLEIDLQTRELQLVELRTALALLTEQQTLAVGRRSARIEAQRQLSQLDDELSGHQLRRQAEVDSLFEAQKKVDTYEGLDKPYEVTRDPTLPTNPSWPNVPLVIGFSIAAGLAIGLGLAFLLEFAQPGFRGTSEVSRGLGLPVLGVVNEITTRAMRRRRSLRRIAIGASTIVLLGSLGWVTWAWLNDPRLLGTDFARFLDGLHEKLR